MARWCGSSTPAELRARRGRSLGLTAREEREGSAGGSERAHGHQQVKAGAWALARRGVTASRRASAGEREARRGPGPAKRLREQGRGAEAGQAACATGPKMRRKAHEGINKMFQINLNSFFIQMNFWTKSKQFQTLGQK